VFAALLLLAAGRAASGAVEIGDYEGRNIAAVEVVLENSPRDPGTENELLGLLHVSVGGQYSSVRIHDSLLELFKSKLVSTVRVEVSPATAGDRNGPVKVRFIVRRQPRISSTRIDIAGIPNSVLSANEIKSRLNLLEPGAPASEQALRNNADLIQAYLRDRGFFKADVDFTQQPDPADTTGSRVAVIFHITPNEQSHVSSFTIKIAGFDASTIQPQLKLQNGSAFSRTVLGEDLAKIRQAIIANGFLAPQIDDPRTPYDSKNNSVAIGVSGSAGPKVNVIINNYKADEKVLKDLLPVKREGSIDPSAIVEGSRRLRNRLQEEGYFFAEVTESCSVTPPVDTKNNGTGDICETLNPEELAGHTVNITYNVELGRRFKLTDIRIEGTDKLTYLDVESQLRSKKANALGFIPFLGGYGRGYTSKDLLEQDRQTVAARIKDLGYRQANVTARQGVSINGDNLIITFVVEPGPLTRVAGIDIRGNSIFTKDELDKAIVSAGKERCRNRPEGDTSPCYTTVPSSPFSRSQARTDGDAILAQYAKAGYLSAQMDFGTVDLPVQEGDQQVRLVYTIRNEGEKVIINDIIINGLVRTRPEAIRRAIPLHPGEILRADKITESERILYATDAFRQVIIHSEQAGENATGYKQSNVIIDVEELKPRVMHYGGGYSTDYGPLGFVDVRNVNLFGDLRQGGFRIRASRLQQLARVEYLDPRFKPYSKTEFSPLTLSIQYQRDSTVTRFFRTTIDQGNNGIVQRLDANGNPIDTFGNRVPEPTINRLTFSAQTQRSLDPKSRNILFLSYSYEDVRIFNLDSLLVAEILRPDSKVRLSRLGASFVRDTRDNQLDPSRGEYFNVDYSLALRALGGNLSFNKLLLNYRRYYMVKKLRRTIFAGNVSLGMANLFHPIDRDGIPGITEADLRLPISERFFSGGSTTLRGFGYEEAGPRFVIPNCTGINFTTCFQQFGLFRDQNGNLVRLNPFTVPIGGNALAVVNLEARMNLTRLLQMTPFYDGGNVFRSVGELFGRQDSTIDPNLRAHWTNTIGIGFGVKTPFGGGISIDYGYLLNPPVFQLPQADGNTAFFRPKHGHIHFRFTRSF